jgi:hypothetical protein
VNRQLWWVAVGAVALAIAASCGGAKACVPGQSVACVGPAGCRGGQICNSDGQSFGLCNCGSGGGFQAGGGINAGGGGDFAGGPGGGVATGGGCVGCGCGPCDGVGGGAGGGQSCIDLCDAGDFTCDPDSGSEFTCRFDQGGCTSWQFSGNQCIGCPDGGTCQLIADGGCACL